MTTSAPIIEPFLEPLDHNGDYILPKTQYIVNAAVLVVFAYLVALVIMEINYFRFAVWRAWRRMERQTDSNPVDATAIGGYYLDGGIDNNLKHDKDDEENIVEKNCTRSVSSSDISEGGDEDDAENIHSESNEDAIIQIGQGTLVKQPTSSQSQVQRSQQQHSSVLDQSVHSAIGHLLQDVRSNLPSLQPTTPLRIAKRSSSIISIDSRSSGKCLNHGGNVIDNPTSNNKCSPTLQKAYRSIHTSSLLAIVVSLVLYAITAIVISLFTRGLEDKVIAVVVGSSKFVASVIVFILSAKVPQWIGVYHEGAIRLAKCSSNLSIHFMKIDISNDESLIKLRHHVFVGVTFHFAKFYILLLPFYCGVRPITIPFSIITGCITGFVLMWCIFLVHERYRKRRNIVASITIFICSVVSSLLFVRGMAWIQVIWDLTLANDENAILVTSFFGWLVGMMVVHALFVWNTLRMEKRYKKEASEGDGVAAGSSGVSGGTEVAIGNDDTIEESSNHLPRNGHQRKTNNHNRIHTDTTAAASESFKMRRMKSYDSFLFDPRFHEDSFQCYKDPYLCGDEKMVGLSPSRSVGNLTNNGGNRCRTSIETTPIVASSSGSALAKSDEDSKDGGSGKQRRCKQRHHRRRPVWCEIFMCFSPEYMHMSCFWKMISWIKVVVVAVSYLLCLYFVTVALGATHQQANTRKNLPTVRNALYETQNEGPVCAFDNQGAASNITTFVNKDAAHDAGFLVLHCGACGACSTWENLIIEYTTRNIMAALANKCAMRGLIGGQDRITKCIMEPPIGFTGQCAVCWAEDIVCTKKNCVFIFLQSQITNNVANFAVGPDDITSASCEEAHCEVGAFVPCVGATRRRMNIISSIPRPVEEQCQVVDVDWAELFAEYV